MSRDILLQKIDEVRSRQRSVAIGQGAARVVLAAIGLVLAFFLVDWLILARSTPGSGDRLARGILVAAMLVTLGWVVWRSLIRVLLHTPDDDAVALKVERGHPELRGRLISTIQLRRSGTVSGSKELIAALEEDTVAFVGPKHFTDIIDLALLKKVALWATGVILLAGALGAWRSDFAAAILARLALTETSYPTSAKIVKVTEGITTARGEPFTITIELDPTGTLPEKASATIRDLSPDGNGRSTELALTRQSVDSNVYVGTIDQVLSDLEFRPAAHDALWPRYERIIAVDRPAIKALALAYRFPDYLNKKPESSAVGDIRAPEGSQVTITARFNRLVTSAKLVTRNDQQEQPPIDLKLIDSGSGATIDLPILADGSWKLLLRTEDGFDNKNPIDYVIDAVADRAPTAKISFPAQDKTVTRFARWPVRFSTRDDHGVAKGRLKYVINTADEALAGTGAFTVDTQPTNAQSLDLAGLVQGQPRPEAGGEVVFDLRTLGLTGDCRITYWIEVEDGKTPTPNKGISPTYVFTVVEAAVLEEMLERDRNSLIDSLKTIRTKQKDGRDGVDTLRRELQDTPAEPPK
ncbi:MAG: hypothetical protein H0W78_15675 [Planctomycetes bacterium]|nr:hypothetical protein [Planctomycetota bacterium]